MGEGSCQLSSDISFVPEPRVRVARAGGRRWGGVGRKPAAGGPCDVRLPHGSQGGGLEGEERGLLETHGTRMHTHARAHTHVQGHASPLLSRGPLPCTDSHTLVKDPHTWSTHIHTTIQGLTKPDVCTSHLSTTHTDQHMPADTHTHTHTHPHLLYPFIC